MARRVSERQREILKRNQFQPGQSGNPDGYRGPKRGIARAAREVMGDDPSIMLTVLFDVALNTREKTSDRIAAASHLLDRGCGKAPSHAPIENSDPLELSELDAAIVDIANRLKAAHTSEEPTVVRGPSKEIELGGAVVTVDADEVELVT